MQGDVETYCENGQWKNKVEGGERATSTHGTKEEAVEAGREMAKERKVEHVIRNQDGTIAEKHSYGHDPRDIPG
ncbi:DUF2188 domain-containing protein [Amycolatopsis sp. NPDC089917]|uniref:DUF2188 domain-containing protein n=1 Tax=Amycolatopsis thailandensis TaxID=589330 RepID=A0A229SB30_9PSEU|nr:DUF2188 domain-containing protein [Amycolatopsis thailandensis]OXM56137.1 hypothetical protein CFP71_15060 [Amycolatopsis thailandensis]